jgi:hypothetical protein
MLAVLATALIAMVVSVGPDTANAAPFPTEAASRVEQSAPVVATAVQYRRHYRPRGPRFVHYYRPFGYFGPRYRVRPARYYGPPRYVYRPIRRVRPVAFYEPVYVRPRCYLRRDLVWTGFGYERGLVRVCR